MSDALVKYAEDEMRRAGLYDSDADYGGALAPIVLEMVRQHSEADSGMSHFLALEIFNKVTCFRPLTPLTNSADEWFEVQPKLWQSSRCPSAFSLNAGVTYYDLDEKQDQWICRLGPPPPPPNLFGRIYGFPAHESEPSR